MSDADGFFSRRRRELSASEPTVPLAFEELERAAREALPPHTWQYTASGAGTGDAMRNNERGFDRWQIVPRVFRGTVERSLEASAFGRTLPAPLALAPIGQLSAYHDAGEVGTARAAADLGVPFTESTVASQSLEDVAEAVPDAPRFFQLYWTDDWAVTRSLVERAERAGYDAVVLTVDYGGPRWIPAHLTTADSRPERTVPNVESDPVARANGVDPAGGDLWDPAVEWEDLAFLREATDLPIVIKGVLHPEDARLAVDHGADGVIVSNHGGRQVDGSVGAITALPRVADAVDGRLPVGFDSGIRSGADAFKALALGADLVFVGRPYLYGLALAGERGVREVLLNLLAELESILGLTGHDDVRDVDRTALLRVDD